MPVFSIELPDKRVVDIEAGDQATAMRGAKEWEASNPKPQQQGWGDYLKGLGREGVQGLTSDFGDELGLVDRQASEQFGAEYPIASTVARIAGSLPLFALGPGAAAARWATAGGSLAGAAGRSALLGAGTGALSGAGAAEGGIPERLEGAATGAAVGGVLGGAVPPALAGASRAYNAVEPVTSFLTRRRPQEPILPFNSRSNPIEGAQFMADGAPPPPPPPAEIAGAQERSVLAARDTMLRAGTTPDFYLSELEAARQAARPHSSGQAQNRTMLADFPEFTRLAGTMARQSPEAAREMTQVMAARQSGITPAGASQEGLAARGIPSVPRLGEQMTGRQAMKDFGTHFGAGLDNVVPTGSRSSIKDWLERFYLIKDKKHHGFGATGIETMEQAAARADANSRAAYDAARKAHAMDNFRKPVDDVFDAALRDAAVKEAPTVERVISQAHELFRPGKPLNLEQFDNTKRVLDNRIKALLSEPDTVHAGGLLGQVQKQLLAAVDDATGGAENSLYAQARAGHASEMQNMQAYLSGRNALAENDALRRTGPLADLNADENAVIRQFQTLSEERQKLWRQGYVDALVAKLPRDVNRSGLRLFNEERVQRVLRETAPAESANRAERLGRYIDFESRMPETRNKAVGGSDTAMRVQDDLMQIATEASQNVQGIMGLLRGNTSLYQLGERMVTAAWDRAFGIGADAARETTRALFTANPAEQQAFLREVAARWPANRMAHFNNLITEAQQYLAASSSMAAGGAAGAPTPTQPRGPEFF